MAFLTRRTPTPEVSTLDQARANLRAVVGEIAEIDREMRQRYAGERGKLRRFTGKELRERREELIAKRADAEGAVGTAAGAERREWEARELAPRLEELADRAAPHLAALHDVAAEARELAALARSAGVSDADPTMGRIRRFARYAEIG